MFHFHKLCFVAFEFNDPLPTQTMKMRFRDCKQDMDSTVVELRGEGFPPEAKLAVFRS